MSEPWFDPAQFGGWFGAIVGGGIGTLGGLLGAMAGVLMPRGKGRRFFVGAFGALMALGLVLLVVGIVALVDGQPYGIWYPLVLTGVVLGVVDGVVLVVFRSLGRELERRKMEADDLRHT